MTRTFSKLSRSAMRRLGSAERITEHGIIFERQANGDGLFSVNVMVDGKRIHRTIGRESDGTTRTQAEEFITRIIQHARENRLSLPAGRKNAPGLSTAVDEYLQRLETSDGRDLRMKRQRFSLHLLPFLGDIPISGIDSFALERYKKHRVDQGAKQTTVNRELAAISHLFTKAEEWGWIDRRPAKIKRFREDSGRNVYLTVEQAKRLVEAAKSDQNTQIYPFVVIALETSMRKTEILTIRRENVDLDRHLIYIPRAKAGPREQPITSYLAEFLRGYLEALPPGTPWLFPSIAAASGRTTDFKRPYKRVILAAGLSPMEINKHTLRHTAISHLVQAGVDLPTVSRISGHKSLAMVLRYAHQNGAHIRAAMDKLEGTLDLAGNPSEAKKVGTITQELHKTKKEGFAKVG